MKKYHFILLSALLTAASVLPARAESFGITNTLAVVTDITRAPTNAADNYTGYMVNVKNVRDCGFYFSCASTNTTNAWVRFDLVRSMSVDRPTSLTNLETASALQVVVPPLRPLAGLTNRLYWCTNLPETFIGAANWVGIRRITNEMAETGSILTNCEAGIQTKLIFTRPR